MREIRIHDKCFVPYISREEIERRIGEMADQISEDYAGDCPILLVMLNGAMFFAVELMKRLRIPVEVCCVKYRSYTGTRSEKMKEVIGLPEERLKGRRVLVVEDIVDTGRTIAYLFGHLTSCGVLDAEVAALTFKQGKYREHIPIRYTGFSISNEFIVGCGMDYDELGRQYPNIYQCKES